MLDTPCSEAVWRVMATHCIRQFPLHFPSCASPCAITFQLESKCGSVTIWSFLSMVICERPGLFLLLLLLLLLCFSFVCIIPAYDIRPFFIWKWKRHKFFIFLAGYILEEMCYISWSTSEDSFLSFPDGKLAYYPSAAIMPVDRTVCLISEKPRILERQH